MLQQNLVCRSSSGKPQVADFVEAGSGPLVVLVHSSMAGARQWSSLIATLANRFTVRAPNLFGYGGTAAWNGQAPPSLDDFADLVASAVPAGATEIGLVGHSLGGAAAMKAASRQLKGRVSRLVLLEPSLFGVLAMGGRDDAMLEVLSLAEETMRQIGGGRPETAASIFIDYWCGRGAWAAQSAERQRAMVDGIGRLCHEWVAVLEDRTGLAEWAAALPATTLLVTFAETVRPSREVVQVLSEASPRWQFAGIGGAGHMGPMTHPQLVDPVVEAFLAQ